MSTTLVLYILGKSFLLHTIIIKEILSVKELILKAEKSAKIKRKGSVGRKHTMCINIDNQL